MKKTIIKIASFLVLTIGLSACSNTAQSAGTQKKKQGVENIKESEEFIKENGYSQMERKENLEKKEEEIKLQVFAAASLKKSMEEAINVFQISHPNVKVVLNADSSGKLMTQIQEGFDCDVFFSAATRQMDTLEKEGFLVENTRKNVVNNQLVVIALKDSSTKVTGLRNLQNATSLAIADGSVPVGRYTRIALNKLGILENQDEIGKITTAQISNALGNIEISEQSNVSKVLTSVVEGSSEVGTVYYSDIYGFEDKIQILEKVAHDLTGNIIYPIACIKNEEADKMQRESAKEFVDFVTSSDAKKIFEAYYFDTNVE